MAKAMVKKAATARKATARKAANTRKIPSIGRPVYIIDGARTPFLKSNNKPGPFTPVDLAVAAGKPLLARQSFDPQLIEDVILGCVNVHPDEVNPGRVAALRLDLGLDVPGWTVQRNCASGIQSIDTAWRNIANGQMDLILAGGAEALSHAPLTFSDAAATWFGQFMTAKTTGQKLAALGQFRPGFFKPSISLLRGLTDPVAKINMGQTAEILAHRFNISRRDCDIYAAESHHRLARAHADDQLPELAPVIDQRGTIHDFDNGVRPNNSADDLGKLRPVFERPFGKVTAGNSSQVSDGAAWAILASEDAVKRYKLKPMARIIDTEWQALD